MGADWINWIQRPFGKHERNPMNMATTVGKHRFGNGDRW